MEAAIETQQDEKAMLLQPEHIYFYQAGHHQFQQAEIDAFYDPAFNGFQQRGHTYPAADVFDPVVPLTYRGAYITPLNMFYAPYTALFYPDGPVTSYPYLHFPLITPEIMDRLGREDCALLLHFRFKQIPNSSLRDIMHSLLREIEQQHQSGTINRASGPLNAEDAPPIPRVMEIEQRNEHERDGGRGISPMLNVRNDAMLGEARKWSGLSEEQLQHVLSDAEAIVAERSARARKWRRAWENS